MLPSVEFLLADKVRTAPARTGRDSERKQLKDLLDIRNLVLFNRAGLDPLPLRRTVPVARRTPLVPLLDRLASAYPDYAADLDNLWVWLEG